MILYDRSQATEHIQFKMISSMRNYGSLANEIQNQNGHENKTSFKKCSANHSDSWYRFNNQNSRLDLKKKKQNTVLVTGYKQTENQFENQRHFEKENQSQVILIKMLLQIMTANLNIKINTSTATSLW